MSREIKFRAWDKSEQWFVSPDYIARDGTAWWKANSIPTSSKDVQQYTGLKDKNGVEIYEGDILRGENISSPLEVIFLEGCFYAHNASKRVKAFSLANWWNGEIIGNIMENPELLK